MAGAAPDPSGEQIATPAPLIVPLCSAGSKTASERPELLTGFGTGGFAIATSVPLAQLYFDNGMRLAFAFEHGAAVAAMREAARLDPACAACLWGEAWASGPTINYPIGQDEAAKAAKLVERARGLTRNASDMEKALIEALAMRYPIGPAGYSGVQADAANRAFAEAMDKLARRLPKDDSIAVLTADAWMIATPWHARRGPAIDRAIALLETVLKRRPGDTAAIHFYIHATEWRGDARRAEGAADRLPALAPAASHLIHMPSHTYMRIGRYRDAMLVNRRAAEVGLSSASKLGLKPGGDIMDWGYHAHNVRFGVGAALLSDDAEDALALAKPMIDHVASGRADDSAFAQLSYGTAYFGMGRFADPRQVLALPAPPARLKYAEGFWRYARGEAAARSGDARAVRSEARAIRIPRSGKNDFGAFLAGQALRIAKLALEGRASMMEGRHRAALAAFRRAARLQSDEGFADSFDPPAFWYPVSRDAAVALLALGKPREAALEADAALALFAKDPTSAKIRERALSALGQERRQSTSWRPHRSARSPSA